MARVPAAVMVPILGVLVGGLACDDGDENPPDASSDAAVDAASDGVGQEHGPEMTLDAATERGLDSPVEIGPDTISDAEPDVAPADDLGGDQHAADTPAECGPITLERLRDATFTFAGIQEISKETRIDGRQCMRARTMVSVHTRVRLQFHDDLWFVWYEGPYQQVVVPNGFESPATHRFSSSPPTPFVHPMDSARKGIPLRIRNQDQTTVTFAAGPFGQEPAFERFNDPLDPIRYQVPMCAQYNYSDQGTAFDNTFSSMSVSVSLATGAVSISHTCATHATASGCDRPTHTDRITGTGNLVCDGAAVD